MIKRAFLLALLAATGAFRPALAAECGDIPSGPAVVNMADLVFEGTALKTEPELLGRISERFYNYSTEYKIDRLYRGVTGDSAIIKIYYRAGDDGDEPAVPLVKTELPYLVFAKLDQNGRYHFEPCARNFMRLDVLEQYGPNQGTRDALMTLENRSERLEKILKMHRNVDRDE